MLSTARECHDDGVGLAVFPELTLTGYSLDDILLQDTLLDAVDDALAAAFGHELESLATFLHRANHVPVTIWFNRYYVIAYAAGW